MLLEDFVQILYPELNVKQEAHWWQNVYTEHACTGSPKPTQSELAAQCSDPVNDPFVSKRKRVCADQLNRVIDVVQEATPIVTPTAAPTANTAGATEASSSNNDDGGYWYIGVVVGVAVAAVAGVLYFRVKGENDELQQQLIELQGVSSSNASPYDEEADSPSDEDYSAPGTSLKKTAI